MGKIFLAFYPNVFGTVVKTRFYVFIRTFSAEDFLGDFSSFSDIEQKPFGSLSENIQGLLQNCLLRVQRNF